MTDDWTGSGPQETGAAPAAPTKVPLVFGILNLAWFALALCGVGMSLPILALEQGAENPQPAYEVLAENAFVLGWTKTILVLGMLAALVLLGGGIGLLMRRRWGRTLSRVWAIYALLTGLVGSVISVVYVVQPLMERAQEAANDVERGAMIGGAVGGLLGGVCSLAYPAVLLWFMGRPHVKAALA